MQRTTASRPRKQPLTLPGRQVPYDAEVELAALGAALLGNLPADVVAPAEFYVPAHQRVAAALVQAWAETGAPDEAVVRSYLASADHGAVVEALAGAAIGKRGAAAAAKRVTQLAAQRARVAELLAEADKLAPPLPPGPEPPALRVVRDHEAGARADFGGLPRIFAGGQMLNLVEGQLRDDQGELYLSWAPSVEAAHMNGGEAHYRVRVGQDVKIIRASQLRDGSAWDAFPEATGRNARGRKEAAADIVLAQGAPVLQRVHPPGWDEGRFSAPPPAAVDALELRGLRGYNQVGPEATRETWRSLLAEVVAVPALALYVGGALGGVFLSASGLECQLDPLGFCVHVVGEGGQGKTTAQRVAASVLGNPANASSAGGGLVRAWNASALGLSTITAQIGALPLVISDTSAWRRGGDDLAKSLMAVFEGPRDVSSRDGQHVERGCAYQSLILSSGNETITAHAPGSPILRRVVEVPAPLTTDAAHALRLKVLASRAYGAPLAAVAAGELTAEQFRYYQAAAAEVLVDVADPPVVQDVALRCSVLVGGAGVLGAFVGEEEAFAMATEAAAGAADVLEALRVALQESHRPVADELYAGVWERYSARPWAYPAPAEGSARDGQVTEGWRRPDGAVALLASTLRSVAKELTLGDTVPALRGLRSSGLLQADAGRLQSRLRVGASSEPVLVYVFAAPRDETPEPAARAPLGDPWAPARAPDAERCARNDPPPPAPRAPRAPRAPVCGRGLKGHECARWLIGLEAPFNHPAWAVARRLGLVGTDGLWAIDPEQWTAEQCAEVEAAGRPEAEGVQLELGPEPSDARERSLALSRPIMVGPVARASRNSVVGVGAASAVVANPLGVAEVLPPTSSLVAVAELLERLDVRVAWVTRSGAPAMGLPAQLPMTEFGHGVPHGQVDALAAAGWSFRRPSKRPGLAPVMALHRGAWGCEVRVAHWTDGHECQWPYFAALDDPAELAREVLALQLALWPDRAWSLNYGPIATFRALSATLQRSHPVEALRGELPAPALPELPTWLAPEVPEVGYVSLWDRNKAFLAALGTVELPTGQLSARGLEALQRGSQGLVKADPAGGAVAELGRPVRGEGPLWLPSTLAGLAAEDPASFGELRASDARVGEALRWFRPVTDRLREGLERLEHAPAATAELKRVYSKGVQVLDDRRYCEGIEQWYRPDWKALVLGQHVANTWRALLKAQRAGAVLVGTGMRDTAAFWTPEPGQVPPGLVLGRGPGAWKAKGVAVPSAQVAALVAGGGRFGNLAEVAK